MGPQGICVPCSPPCAAYEAETMKCKTEHNLLCSEQWTTQVYDGKGMSVNVNKVDFFAVSFFCFFIV